MDMLSTNCWATVKSSNLYLVAAFQFFGRDGGLCGSNVSLKFSTRLCHRNGGNINALAGKNQIKKSRRKGKTQKEDNNLQPIEQTQNENDGVDKSFSDNVFIQDGNNYKKSSDNIEIQTSVIVPSRNAVLQACTVTSGLMGALGFLIRQVSHVASGEGWPIVDSSENITFSFELWHLELIAGSVILVSSCRFLLLKTWPDFAKSSEAANQQVLTSLDSMDYLVVAFLPGISEELLFRGALLPLFGLNWTSILAVAVLFGILHLGGGRKYSFAIWAIFVGILYGYTATFSSSVTVPMASHALNNLVGGIIWRYQRRLDSLQQ